MSGALIVELNLKCAGWALRFDKQIEGPATQVMPAFVERVCPARAERSRFLA
ncbi:hypothetical protein [Mesorhizobium sp. B4-1-3]|uniref:hypothetical protein n=1 Tax=Mesorhizobium sp. B4-1-3 TaxID=2589889 RepID=UPI0015E46809|nr:hypothetical protein [Mesorhizobium sp. B4-1-3]